VNQSKKLQQFTKLCKSGMSQNSKTAKMVLGRFYIVCKLLKFFALIFAVLVEFCPNFWYLIL